MPGMCIELTVIKCSDKFGEEMKPMAMFKLMDV